MEIIDKVESDNKFTAKCRALQNYYRAKILNADYGNGPCKNSITRYGNYLVNGDRNGLNFLNVYSFRYAKQKVLEKRINPDLTIDEYRLFNNMLSSMPMAFNLFGLLRKILEDDHYQASEIATKVFPNIKWLKKLVYLDIEFVPRPIKDYTNDKSAFDVFILGSDEINRQGIITIETKYTD